jgi:hypothetical protein
MAKTTSKKENEFNLGKISSVIEGLSKKSLITIDNLKRERKYIGTGIYILNALLSKSILKGGVPTNRFTIFAGPYQTGKSYICLNIVRNAQKERYNVIYIDTEFSIENSDFDMFGIDTSDPNKFMLVRSNKVENLKIFLAQLLDELKSQKEKGEDVSKTIFIIDSLGALASKKEVEDAIKGADKQDMSRAKATKSMLRIIIDDLGYLNIPLVATNHTYLCLTGGHKILKSDGSYELIENLKKGDTVKTLDGDKPVIEIYEYPKSPIIKLTLENGDIIKCTPQHKFLIKENWNRDENNECWKKAEDLKEDDIILSVENV